MITSIFCRRQFPKNQNQFWCSKPFLSSWAPSWRSLLCVSYSLAHKTSNQSQSSTRDNYSSSLSQYCTLSLSISSNSWTASVISYRRRSQSWKHESVKMCWGMQRSLSSDTNWQSGHTRSLCSRRVCLSWTKCWWVWSRLSRRKSWLMDSGRSFARKWLKCCTKSSFSRKLRRQPRRVLITRSRARWESSVFTRWSFWGLRLTL